MRANFYLLTFLLFLTASHLFAQSVLYVAPNGSASNPGTLASPTTLDKAITSVTVGGTIYLRGGNYAYSVQITVERGNNGAAGSTKKLFAYSGEKPVLDFSSQPYTNAGPNARGLQINGHYWHVKGLEVKGSADNGIYVAGNNNLIEQCITRGNRDSGLQLGRYASSVAKPDWPANNLILNCDSYDNSDPDNGEDADGFACKLTTGPGNTFRGCHAWNNVDDGWDLYTKSETGPIDPVTFEGCVANNNGVTSDGTFTANSDGNGFKLGGEKIAVNHSVTRCVSYNNKKHGFTYNSNPGNIRLTNNTSWNNKGSNFAFDLGSHTFTNNLSYKGASSDKTSGTDVSGTNVWWKSNASTNAKGLLASDADFASLAPTYSRGADGSLNLGNFLHLAAGSDLINAGVPATGITYSGSAPDIGAFEYGGTTPPPTTYTLTVNATAGGTVAKSPDAASYTAGTVVTLTATPASGYAFSGWSGAASGSSASVTVTMDANKTVTATFSATGTTTPSVVLSATAGNASVALNWTVTNSSSVTGQEVYRDTDSNPTGRVRIASLGATVRSYTDNTAQNGTPYYYWIKAITASASYDSNVVPATPQGTGGGGTTTLRIEDATSFSTGYCSADGSRQNSYTGAENGFYVNLSNSSAKGINWKVSVPAAGSYGLKWRYANGGSSSATTAKVLVNGATAVGSVSFPRTSTWSTWSTTTATVNLGAGVNTIRLETILASEFANIDWIEITGTSPTAAACGAARLGAVELPLGNALTVYPNPASQVLHVQTTGLGESATIYVLNSQGQTVLSTKATAADTPLAIAHLPAGLYLLKVISGGNVATKKFFVH